MANTVNPADVYASAGLTTTQTADKPKKSSDMTQEAFLKLMTAQMQNQDPTQPMANGEFLSQIAQFSAVNGMKQLNDSFSMLSSSMMSQQALQASSLIGRYVLVPGSTGVLPPDGVLTGAADLVGSSPQVTLEVKDSVGQVVRRVDLGPQQSGQIRFGWDGRDANGQAMPPGLYQISVQADVGGKPTALNTMVDAQVQSVSLGGLGQGITVMLQGLGPVELSKVKEIS